MATAKSADPMRAEVVVKEMKESMGVRSARYGASPIYGPGRNIKMQRWVAESLGLDYEGKPARQAKATSLNDLTVDELEAEIKRRNLQIPEKGSGADGNVVKADLVKVLEAAPKGK